MVDVLSLDSKSALLVIDLQVGMFNGERLPPIHRGEAMLARVRALLAQARSAGVPVIYVRHAGGPGHLLERNTPNWEIHPTIAPASGEIVVDKPTPDAFYETMLSGELATVRAKRLVMVGAQTEICVDTTCRRAFSLGFEVDLVSDAHSTWDNSTLTADQIIQHTNETLSEWFVRLIPADDARLVGGSDRQQKQ
jgi:nicotinamidase-related amidase